MSTKNGGILTPVFAEFQFGRTDLGLAERKRDCQSVSCQSKRAVGIDCFVLAAPRSISRKSASTHWTDSYVRKLI